MQDIRWKQRFENFEKAFLLLANTFEEQDEFSDLEQEGVIQRFEYTFELAWKTLKDYLEFNGVILEEATPRKVIKQSFEAKVIKNGQDWIEMLLQRNLLSHTYDQAVFNKTFDLIQNKYIFIFNEFYNFLKEQTID